MWFRSFTAADEDIVLSAHAFILPPRMHEIPKGAGADSEMTCGHWPGMMRNLALRPTKRWRRAITQVPPCFLRASRHTLIFPFSTPCFVLCESEKLETTSLLAA